MKVDALDQMELKNYSLAIFLYESMIQHTEFSAYSDKHLVYQMLGVCFFELKMIDEAICAYKLSLAVSPEPTATEEYVSLADTHSLLSAAYEEKSAYGKQPPMVFGGKLSCH